MNSTTPEAVAAHLSESVCRARRRYRKRLERCQEKFSDKAVHRLRIETRRILALLDLLSTLHFEESTRKLRKMFKQRLDAFDDLRDTQVQLTLLKPLWARYPEARPFRSFLSSRERKLILELHHEINTMKIKRLNRLLKELGACLGQRIPARAFGLERICEALQAAFARVVTLRRHVQPGAPSTIHQMRVAFKRYRYLAELLQPVVGGIRRDRLERMKQYQADAGDIQDLEVLLATLARAVKARKVNPTAIRNLRGELLHRREHVIKSFVSRMDDLTDFRPVFRSQQSATARPRSGGSGANRNIAE